MILWPFRETSRGTGAPNGGISYGDLAKFPVQYFVGVELDIAGFVRCLKAMGYRGPWGVEVISAEFTALPLAEAASRNFSTSAPFVV